MTPYQLHVQNWVGCTRCPLAAGRKRVCLVRGSLPCDVLFVGEAPGESEDVLGAPFKGPAGRLLDSVIGRVFRPVALCSICGTVRTDSNGDWVCRNGHDRSNSGGRDVTYALTNLVGCIPRDPDGGKATEPDVESITACGPRLQEVVDLARPRLVVAVGKLPVEWLEQGVKGQLVDLRGTPLAHMLHPAAVLRAQAAAQGLMVQKMVVSLSSAVREYL